MAKRSFGVKPNAFAARLCTILAGAMWGFLFLDTLFAYAGSHVEPANAFSSGFVRAYAVALALVTVGAWVWTQKPANDVLAAVYMFWRMMVLAIMGVVVVGVVIHLGPDPKPEPTALMNVIDALIVGVLAIGAPLFINLIRPRALRRSSWSDTRAEE